MWQHHSCAEFSSMWTAGYGRKPSQVSLVWILLAWTHMLWFGFGGFYQGPRWVLPPSEVTVWREPWAEAAHYTLLWDGVPHSPFPLPQLPSQLSKLAQRAHLFAKEENQVDQCVPPRQSSRSISHPAAISLVDPQPLTSPVQWSMYKPNIGAGNTFFLLPSKLGGCCHSHFCKCIPWNSNHTVFYSIPDDMGHACWDYVFITPVIEGHGWATVSKARLGEGKSWALQTHGWGGEAETGLSVEGIQKTRVGVQTPMLSMEDIHKTTTGGSQGSRR